MLTLLPHASFRYSAVELGSELIAYQKSDCLKIIRLINTRQDIGHAVFNMWRGHYRSLYNYCHDVFDVFDAIFYVDEHCRLVLPKRDSRAKPPKWLGNMELHDGHKGYLAQKHPAFFRKWREYPSKLYLPGVGV